MLPCLARSRSIVPGLISPRATNCLTAAIARSACSPACARPAAAVSTIEAHSARNMPQTIPATLIPGDGIGPEIVDATLAALDALGAPFEWERQIAGLEGVKVAGDPLPKATLDSIRRTRLALKGPLETPSGGGYRSSNVRLREELGLYANLRPRGRDGHRREHPPGQPAAPAVRVRARQRQGAQEA